MEWVMSALQVIHHNLGRLTMATDDLSSAVSRSEAATTAALAAINTEIEQLRAALDELAKVPNTAAIVARMNANTDRIEAATSGLGADDAPAQPPAP